MMASTTGAGSSADIVDLRIAIEAFGQACARGRDDADLDGEWRRLIIMAEALGSSLASGFISEFGLADIKRRLGIDEYVELSWGGASLATDLSAPNVVRILSDLLDEALGDVVELAPQAIALSRSIRSRLNDGWASIASEKGDGTLFCYEDNLQLICDELNRLKQVAATSPQAIEGNDGPGRERTICERTIQFVTWFIVRAVVGGISIENDGWFIPRPVLKSDPMRARDLSESLRFAASDLGDYYRIQVLQGPFGPMRISRAYSCGEGGSWESDAYHPENAAWLNYSRLIMWASEIAVPVANAVVGKAVEIAADSGNELARPSGGYLCIKSRGLRERYSIVITSKVSWCLFGFELMKALADTEISPADMSEVIHKWFSPEFDIAPDEVDKASPERRSMLHVMRAVGIVMLKGIDIQSQQIDQWFGMLANARDIAPGLIACMRDALTKSRATVAQLTTFPEELSSASAATNMADSGRRAADNGGYCSGVAICDGIYSSAEKFELPSLDKGEGRLRFVTDFYQQSALLHMQYVERIRGVLLGAADSIDSLAGPSAGQVADIILRASEVLEEVYDSYSSADIYLPGFPWAAFVALPGVSRETFSIANKLRRLSGEWYALDPEFRSATRSVVGIADPTPFGSGTR